MASTSTTPHSLTPKSGDVALTDDQVKALATQGKPFDDVEAASVVSEVDKVMSGCQSACAFETMQVNDDGLAWPAAFPGSAKGKKGVTCNDSQFVLNGCGRPDPQQLVGIESNEGTRGGFDDEWNERIGQPAHAEQVDVGGTGMKIGGVKCPSLISGYKPGMDARCFVCGGANAHSNQLFHEVFNAAVKGCDGDKNRGHQCLRGMIDLLVGGADTEGHEEVLRRTTVCNNVQCQIRQQLLTPAKHEINQALSPDNKRIVLGRSSDNQDNDLKENLELLHKGMKDMGFANGMRQPALLPTEVCVALQHLGVHSNWFKMREGRCIATAMCIVASPETFGYTFSDPQSFVNRMAGFVHGYLLHVLVPFVCDTTLSDKEWKAKLTKLVTGTGMPKAVDVAMALLMEDNAKQWECGGEPLRDADGRRVHAISSSSAKNADFFTTPGFQAALGRCIAINGEYKLKYASSGDSRFNNNGNLYAAIQSACGSSEGFKNYHMHEMVRACNGSLGRRTEHDAHADTTSPTCGQHFNNDQCNPLMRYTNVFVAMGCSQEEACDKVGLFLEHHPAYNTIGKQQLKSGKGGVATHTFRPPTVREVKVHVRDRSLPAHLILPGEQKRSLKASMDIEVLAKRSIRVGDTTLLGFDSKDSRFKSVGTKMFEAGAVAYDSKSKKVPSTLARTNLRNLAIDIDPQASAMATRVRDDAQTRATEQWLQFEQECEQSQMPMTKAQFLEIGAQRSWALQEQRKRKLEEEFRASGCTSTAEFAKQRRIDPALLLSPEDRDRAAFAQILKDMATVEKQNIKNSVTNIKERHDKAKKHNEDLRQRARDRAKAIKKLKEKNAESGKETKLPRQHDEREQLIAVPKNYLGYHKATIARLNAELAEELNKIDCFARGEVIESYDAQWREWLKVRYGGMMRQHIRDREVLRGTKYEDAAKLARRRLAAKLVDAIDERAAAEESQLDSGLMAEGGGDTVDDQREILIVEQDVIRNAEREELAAQVVEDDDCDPDLQKRKAAMKKAIDRVLPRSKRARVSDDDDE